MKIHRINQESLFTIMDLGGLIHSPEDLEKVLNFLVEKVAGLMNVDACSLYLYNKESSDLILKATYGLNKDLIGRLHVNPETGLTGQTIKLLKPISVADAKKNKNFHHEPELHEEDYSAFLSAPLVYNGDPIGVIVLQNKTATKFSKRDVDFLLTLCIPAVGLIEKAKFMGTVGSLTSLHRNYKSQDTSSDITHEYLKDHIMKGIPAVPGIAMGRLKLVKQREDQKETEETEIEIANEIEKLKKAFADVAEEIRETKKQAEARFGPDEASIFEAYLLFLESASFQNQILAEIKKGQSAIKGLDFIVSKYMERMNQAQDEYIKERAYDIQDVARKITDKLLYGAEIQANKFHTEDDTIFSNDFWSISDFVHLDTDKTQGIISANGGASSHISILADTLNIPCVLGLGTNTTQLRDGDEIILDGFSGQIIVNPSKQTLDIYQNEIEKLAKRQKQFEEKKDQKVKIGIKEKKPFPIGANLGMAAHVHPALDSGADMVGLYRTEFPFLMRNTLPTEEEQFNLYKRVLELLKNKEVVFRTLDIGGDKYVPYLNLPTESNPALGWRAVRFSLERKDLFRIQLRAILRASAFGKVKILIPMITSLDELWDVKDVLESVKKELADEGAKFSSKVPLGVMVEVPSAVEIAEKLAKEVDFFSLGTNDLVQYTLGVDRTNPLVAKIYDPFHPAVLKLIQRTLKSAKKMGISTTVCGDMAGQPYTAALLMGLGVDGLSMIPRAVPRIKYLARKIDLEAAQKLANKCLRLSTGTQVKLTVENFFSEYQLGEFAVKGRAPLLET